MKKRKVEAFGKKVYLLGKDNTGKNYWLCEGSWDCGWYWGLGYVQSFTNNNFPDRSRDLESHSHFYSMFLEGDCYNSFKSFFSETVLNDKEIWKLLEIMSSLYTMRKYSDMLYCGGGHISENPLSNEIKSLEEYDRINKNLIPKLLDEAYKILSD